MTVEEQQKELELGIRGTMWQTLLEETQTLPQHVLISYKHTTKHIYTLDCGRVFDVHRKRDSPLSVHRSTYTWAAIRQYISECCSSVFRASFPVDRKRYTLGFTFCFLFSFRVYFKMYEQKTKKSPLNHLDSPFMLHCCPGRLQSWDAHA